MKDNLRQMWKLCYTGSYKNNVVNYAFSILIVFALIMCEIFHFFWNIVCFLTRSIVLMSFFWELLNCVTLFLVKSCINLVEKKVAYSQYKFDRTQKSACWLRLLVFQRHKSSFCFDIRGPRFFLRVAITIISKRFVNCVL